MNSVERQRCILIVDDVPLNIKLLADLLEIHGYAVQTATGGIEALASVEAKLPDLVLLDVMMPDLSGYEVCRRLRERPESALLPVVMVTALDPAEERVKGIEAGADDFLSKPINAPELMARVRSLLRIGDLHAQVTQQAAQLAEWNRELETRVEAQVAELSRLQQLSSYLPREVARLVIDDSADHLLKPKRRNVAICAVDMRGFTPYAEKTEPDELLRVLSQYYAAIGDVAEQFDGTIEHFAGDGMIVMFNAPLEIDQPVRRAVDAAIAMQKRYSVLHREWGEPGRELGFGIGIACGEASIGALGYDGFWQYCAIGPVTNLASRLCSLAAHGEILLTAEALEASGSAGRAGARGPMEIRGFQKPVDLFCIDSQAERTDRPT